MQSAFSRLLPRVIFLHACLAVTSLQAALPGTSCLESVDAAVARFNSGDSAAARKSLQSISPDCEHVPQLHHNLGVLDAATGNWDKALKHFQRALSEDARAAMTVRHLQAIHQYRASEAYNHALGLREKITQPDLHMQGSADVNAQPAGALYKLSELHTASTVDYELYAWWNAAADRAHEPWLEHYVRGYPPLENTDAIRIAWEDVQRDITFTAQDAVVLLAYDVGSTEKRALLFLRLQDNRWKIYRETRL